jgi:hypothetical protein
MSVKFRNIQSLTRNSKMSVPAVAEMLDSEGEYFEGDNNKQQT